MVNGLHLLCIGLFNVCLIYTLIYTLVAEATMLGANLLTRSSLGFGVLLKDTLT